MDNPISLISEYVAKSFLLQIFLGIGSVVALISLVLRWLLHQRLIYLIRWASAVDFSSVQSPKLIRSLRESIMNLSAEELENVNTSALVMYNFTSEKLFRKLPLENAEYFTRIAPNLLIAIGLLGTFLGITRNLDSVARGLMEIDSSATTTITDLIEQLKPPLEGMAVAFGSSLICLVLGILVTLLNSVWNTDSAKQNLLSELEFRLDKLAGQRQNPTGRLIQSISDNFRIFLDNFQVVVRDAIERPLEREMAQLRQINQENVELANNIFMRFDGVSGTFIRSSQTFELAVSSLQEIVLSEQFSRSVRQLSQLIQAIDKASQTQINLQRIAEQFDNITNVLDHILAILEQLPNRLESVNQSVIEASNLNQGKITSIIDNLGVLMTLSRDNQETYSQLLARLESVNQSVVEASNLNQEKIIRSINKMQGLITLNLEFQNKLSAYFDNLSATIAKVVNQGVNQFRVQEFTNEQMDESDDKIC